MANNSSSLTLVPSARPPMTTDGSVRFSVAVATYLVFIYINCVMLGALRTKDMFFESSRYILFGHMLFNDILHLGTSLVLFILSSLFVDMLQAVCFGLLFISTATFTNEPLNLAVMALERYVAVCLPLRHAQLSTPQRTAYALSLVWGLGCVNVASDILAVVSQEPRFLLNSGYCVREQLMRSSWQRVKVLVLNILFFSLVGTVLLLVYVAITRESRSAATDTASARRALRTVLLHGFQLSLSLLTFLYNVIDTLFSALPPAAYTQLRFVNFFVVLVLPRCLSSLVYGLRDSQLRPVFRHYFTCRSTKVEPIDP